MYYSDCPTEALKRSNDALKDRCEEMEGWQRRSREEREFLSCKFREARALVERLAQENQSLLGKLNYSSNHTATQSPGNYIVTGGQNKNLEGSNAESNGLMDSPGVGLHGQSKERKKNPKSYLF